MVLRNLSSSSIHLSSKFYHPRQWCTEMYHPNLSSTELVLKLRIKRALSAARIPGAQARKRRVRLTLLPLWWFSECLSIGFLSFLPSPPPDAPSAQNEDSWGGELQGVRGGRRSHDHGRAEAGGFHQSGQYVGCGLGGDDEPAASEVGQALVKSVAVGLLLLLLLFAQTNFVVAGKQSSWLRRCLWVEQKTQILWITLVVKKEMWDERCSFDGAWRISRIEIKEVHGKKMHLTAGSSELFDWFFWRSFSGLWRSNPIKTLLTTLSPHAILLWRWWKIIAFGRLKFSLRNVFLGSLVQVLKTWGAGSITCQL